MKIVALIFIISLSLVACSINQSQKITLHKINWTPYCNNWEGRAGNSQGVVIHSYCADGFQKDINGQHYLFYYIKDDTEIGESSYENIRSYFHTVARESYLGVGVRNDLQYPKLANYSLPQNLTMIITNRSSEGLMYEINIHNRNVDYFPLFNNTNVSKERIQKICDGLSNNESRITCLFVNALIDKNTALCNTDDCISDIAFAENNTHLCSSIRSSDHCIFDIGIKTNSIVTCLQINDTILSTNCLVHAGYYHNDTSVCELINYSYYLPSLNIITTTFKEKERLYNESNQELCRNDILFLKGTNLDICWARALGYVFSRDINEASSNCARLFNLIPNLSINIVYPLCLNARYQDFSPGFENCTEIINRTLDKQTSKDFFIYCRNNTQLDDQKRTLCSKYLLSYNNTQ